MEKYDDLPTLYEGWEKDPDFEIARYQSAAAELVVISRQSYENILGLLEAYSDDPLGTTAGVANAAAFYDGQREERRYSQEELNAVVDSVFERL